MPQQIILAPAGIITTPNKLGSTPMGALTWLERGAFRDPGTLTALNTWSPASAALTGIAVNASQAFVHQLTPTCSIVLYAFTGGNQWRATFLQDSYTPTYAAIQIASGAGLPGLSPLGNPSFFAGTGLATLRGRTVIPTNPLAANTRGCVIFDTDDPTSSPAPRVGGLSQPRFFGNPGVLPQSATSNVATAMDVQRHAHYVCVIRRKFDDGYEIFSTPSQAIQVKNTTGAPCSPQLVVLYGPGADGAIEDDTIELYRTKTQPLTIGNASSTNIVYTNTGSDYFLAASYTVTANDITIGVGQYNIADTCPDLALGEALYCNPGLATSAGVSFPPPSCACIARYKSYMFYGAVKEEASITLSIPSGFVGTMFGTDQVAAIRADTVIRRSGIGRRTFTGAAAIGSPTITGIAAADIIGLVIGQQVTNIPGTALPSTPYTIIAVGATSITLDKNAAASGTGNFQTYDVISIALTGFPASVYRITDFDSFAATGSPMDVDILAVDRVVSPGGGPPGAFGGDSVPTPSFTARARSREVDTFSIAATNGQNYRPALPALSAPRLISPSGAQNIVYWSEENQPEYVPPANSAPVGTGRIYGMVANKDALFIWSESGLYRLSGTGGSVGAEGYDWRVDMVSPDIIPAALRSWCVLEDVVYAYTNKGFVSITSAGQIREISAGRVDEILPLGVTVPATFGYTHATSCWVTADTVNKEVWIKVPAPSTAITPFNADSVYVYSVRSDCFGSDLPGTSTVATGSTSAVYHGPLGGMFATYLASASSLSVITPTLSTASSLAFDLAAIYADSPFTMRHWQAVDVAFDTTPNGTTAAATFDVYKPTSSTSSAFGTSVGTKVISSGTDERSMYGRASISIPVDFPSVANNFAPRLRFSSITNASNGNFRLQGISVTYKDLSYQRKDR